MFSRKHPFLYFILLFSAIWGTVTIIASIVSGFGPGSNSVISSKPGIGIVEILGPIYESKKINEDLRAFADDPEIKAIVVRIDSPGGAVGPSQEIYREIEKTRKKKKVIASMGSVAASGGYYAACITDGIMANSGTITGSIGVIMGFTNFKKVMDKIGLMPVVVKSGDMKDVGSPARDMTDEEKNFLQDFVSKIHRQFVVDVAKGRKLEEEYVAKLADGRIYTGQEAVSMKLVDRLGNMDDAVAWAGELAGVKGPVEAIYPPEDKLTFIKKVMESSAKIVKTLFLEPSIKAEYRMQGE